MAACWPTGGTLVCAGESLTRQEGNCHYSEGGELHYDGVLVGEWVVSGAN